jgi:HD-GYP domain-containing protein (c-di-GMP phosphodiesterase class II)
VFYPQEVQGASPSGVRLAELVGALSLATDLGLGQPQQHVLRQTVLARRLAAAAGLPVREQRRAGYVSLLAWVGCISDSHELARWFGDDLLLRADSYLIDKAGLPLMRFMLGHIGAGAPPLRRLTMIGRFLAEGTGHASQSFVAHCQTTGDIGRRLGLDAEVGRALAQAFERWDGKGVPAGLAGDQIDLVMRVVQVADDAEVFDRIGGPDAAVTMLRGRRGTEFDPALVDLCCAAPEQLFGGLDQVDNWNAAIGDETTGDAAAADRELTEAELTTALEAFADYADLKSPSRLGHSRGVAMLATEAARRIGLSGDDVILVQRAALVHDLGVIGVPTNVWDKAGSLSAADRERVRTHPYLTERILSRPPRLAEIGAIAALHHERLDGSGYPRGVRGDALPLAARLVAAADVFHAMGEDRPHRIRLEETERARALRAEAKAGRLDPDAVDAVLHAAGHRVPRRPALPAGLSSREVEVLVLVARGLRNKEIARRLTVSPRTVSSHLEHAFTKIGVTTRGAAAMFAMGHGLVLSEDPAGRPKIG